MKLICTAAAVLNQTPLDWDGNAANIRQAIQDARDRGATLVCLPELCITGYGCEDAFHSPGVQQTAIDVLLELLPETRGLVVTFGLPLMHGGALFNTCALAVDGKLLGFVGKQNLAGEGIHYEPRWFKAWPKDVQSEVQIADERYPIGDLIFDVGGVLFGFEICEDAWVAHRPGADLARQGVDVILNPSASHFAFGKHSVRRRFVLEGSRAFSVSYVYANLLGNEAGRAVYDGDAMIASCGKMLATGPRFSFADVRLTTAQIDVDNTRMNRARTGSFRPVIEGRGEHLVSAPFEYPPASPQRYDDEKTWEKSERLKEEEFTRAVSLALYDYLRKSRSRGFVVSLSGGADSSAVASLCALIVRLGEQELGLEGLLRKLQYASNFRDAETPEQLIKTMLTCAYQSTRNSSDTTRNAARGLAESLGATHLELDVDAIVQQYTDTISDAIGRELTWERDDLTLQNIQARVRSPSVWMLANIQGALLLSTSNRSEAAVGYATMDGDTSGGVSPDRGHRQGVPPRVAGLDGARRPRWRSPDSGAATGERTAAHGRAAAAVRTADGRGRSDAVPAAGRDRARRDPRQADAAERLQTTAARLPAIRPPKQLGVWVERFFRLWCRNQWKRERYAPSFHLDDENLDPKTWCRFPILSGGFERELKTLQQWITEHEKDSSATKRI